MKSMFRTAIAISALTALQAASGAAAQEGGATVSLRIDATTISLPASVNARLASLARETMSRCGPNTRQHPHNFGAAAMLASQRRERALETSRLHVVFDRPFTTVSHLGGRLPVSEVTLGLGRDDLFVGPDFTRHGAQVTEHLQCEYLPSLEIACLPELATHLPSRYRETCAKFERGSDGRIVMPPPDIAPSCS
jgi:hypothetical protein